MIGRVRAPISHIAGNGAELAITAFAPAAGFPSKSRCERYLGHTVRMPESSVFMGYRRLNGSETRKVPLAQLLGALLPVRARDTGAGSLRRRFSSPSANASSPALSNPGRGVHVIDLSYGQIWCTP